MNPNTKYVITGLLCRDRSRSLETGVSLCSSSMRLRVLRINVHGKFTQPSARVRVVIAC